MMAVYVLNVCLSYNKNIEKKLGFEYLYRALVIARNEAISIKIVVNPLALMFKNI